MTFPSVYDPANTARWDYDPPVGRIFEEAGVTLSGFEIVLPMAEICHRSGLLPAQGA